MNNITFTEDDLNDGKRKSLCLYPFFNSMVTASGHYKPCCKFEGHLSDSGRLLHAEEDSFVQAWQCSDVQLLRQQLVNGEKPSGCKVCWDEEKQGIKSMRFDSFDYGLSASTLSNLESPVRLDLYASNICNLRCRICSPHYSSKWIQEAKETQGIHEEIHLNLTPDNFANLKKWLPRMVEIGLFGGEPLYMKEVVQVLEFCVYAGYSSNITLLINTNGTVYNERIMHLFKNFKRVILNFSIDDIENRFEYQRKNASWDDVQKNMHSYLQEGGSIHPNSKIECKICCTVSLFNVYYLPELLHWIDANFPGIQVYLNMLHGPYSLSIRNFPEKVKAEIIDKLSAYKPLSIVSHHSIRTLNDVIELIKLPPLLPFGFCLKEINRGDKFRNEKFGEVFTEINTIIRNTLLST
jgi:sulfatase maturation enzyme AslB (radical SAM superfamily)